MHLAGKNEIKIHILKLIDTTDKSNGNNSINIHKKQENKNCIHNHVYILPVYIIFFVPLRINLRICDVNGFLCY